MLESCGEEGIIHHTLDLLVSKYYWRLSSKIENSDDTGHRGRILGQGSEAKVPELAKWGAVIALHPTHTTDMWQENRPRVQWLKLGFWILRYTIGCEPWGEVGRQSRSEEMDRPFKYPSACAVLSISIKPPPSFDCSTLAALCLQRMHVIF